MLRHHKVGHFSINCACLHNSQLLLQYQLRVCLGTPASTPLSDMLLSVVSENFRFYHDCFKTENKTIIKEKGILSLITDERVFSPSILWRQYLGTENKGTSFFTKAYLLAKWHHSILIEVVVIELSYFLLKLLFTISWRSMCLRYAVAGTFPKKIFMLGSSSQRLNARISY